MNDPYKVLNVSPSASDEDIKKAYRDLARKYHPDNYVDNPLSDLAQEKMKEINEAYDTIVKSRQGTGYSGGYNSQQSNGWSGAGAGHSSNPTYQKIRELIMQGNLPLAESLLDQMGSQSRDAEWNYLKGSILYKKGWTSDARLYFENACRSDPNNAEYRSALNMMNNYGQSYNPYQGQGQNGAGCTPCDCCAGMMCMDMCCNCI